MVRCGACAAAGGPVAELPLRDRPAIARLRPAHGTGRHRPGVAPVLDQHGSAQRSGPRLLPDHRRNGGHALGAVLRLRPAVAPHPTSGVSRSLALHIRSHAEAFTTVSSWSTTDWLKVTENGKTVLRENTKRVAFLEFAELPRRTRQPL